MAGLGIQPRDPCITRKVFYHIPPLTKFLPFKKLTKNTCSPCQDTPPGVTEMRENIEINNFLHRRRRMCEHIKNTEILFQK